MRFLTRALVAVAALLPLACSAADDSRYKLGEHYRQVRQAQPATNPTKIQVTEVFAYSCPHCFQFEPHIEKWLAKKAADVEFVRLPHTLGQPANAARNKAYYTAEMLGVTEKFHHAMFAAIHSKGRMMGSPEELRALFVEATGVKGEDFDGAYNGFAVDSRFRMGENASREMGIASVPTMVVDGKYYTTPRDGGGFPGMLAIVDHLVERARQERKAR